MSQLARLPTRAYLCRMLLLTTASLWALLGVAALWLSNRSPNAGRGYLNHCVRCMFAGVLAVGSSVRILNTPSAVSTL
jgi:hypothetical protein